MYVSLTRHNNNLVYRSTSTTHCDGIAKIRRSFYHDVLRLIDIEGLLNLSYVQTYTINAYKVVFIRRRRRGANSSSKWRNTSCFSESTSSDLADPSIANGSDVVPGHCYVCNRQYASCFVMTHTPLSFAFAREPSICSDTC